MKTKLIFLIFIIFPFIFTVQAKRKKNSNFGISIPISYSLTDSKTAQAYSLKRQNGFIFQGTTAYGAGISLGFIAPVFSKKETDESFIINTNFIEFYYDIPLSELFAVMLGYGIGDYAVICQNTLCKENYGSKEIKTELNTFNLLYLKLGFFVGHLYYITFAHRIISTPTEMIVSSTINDKNFKIKMASSITDFGITAYF